MSLLVFCCYFVFYNIGAFYSPLLYYLLLRCVLLYSFDGELDRNECGGNVYLQSCSSESITLISTAGSHQPLALNTSCSLSIFLILPAVLYFVFLCQSFSFSELRSMKKSYSETWFFSVHQQYILSTDPFWTHDTMTADSKYWKNLENCKMWLMYNICTYLSGDDCHCQNRILDKSSNKSKWTMP